MLVYDILDDAKGALCMLKALNFYMLRCVARISSSMMISGKTV